MLADGGKEGNTWEPTGGIEVKGKGLMDTFLWTQPDGFFDCPVPFVALRGLASRSPSYTIPDEDGSSADPLGNNARSSVFHSEGMEMSR